MEHSFEEVGEVSVSASRDPKFFHSLANLIFLNLVTEPLPKVRVQGREDRFEDKASGDLCAFFHINRYFFRQIWENYHHCECLENQLRKDDRQEQLLRRHVCWHWDPDELEVDGAEVHLKGNAVGE